MATHGLRLAGRLHNHLGNLHERFLSWSFCIILISSLCIPFYIIVCRPDCSKFVKWDVTVYTDTYI
jgi:hypothetical protein